MQAVTRPENGREQLRFVQNEQRVSIHRWPLRQQIEQSWLGLAPQKIAPPVRVIAKQRPHDTVPGQRSRRVPLRYEQLPDSRRGRVTPQPRAREVSNGYRHEV